jgi:glutaredoxin
MAIAGKLAGIALFAGMFTIAGAGAASAKIYKWVDAQGNVHFQDRAPADAGKGAKVEVRASSPKLKKTLPPAPKTPSLVDDRLSAAEYDTQPKRTVTVELYTVSWCPWCKKAHDYFTAQGIPFTEYDIERDPAALARKNELAPQTGVPLAVVNGIKISGYSERAYVRAMNDPLLGLPAK